LKVISKLETIVEELKALPQERLDRAADYIHRLRTISEAERKTIIDRTAGSLTAAEADELERIINEGCERIDE
jgi:2,3-bisphosphoglycerate-independent phosphoglycerate mutase